MKNKIRNTVNNSSIILTIFLVLVFVLNTSAITITPENQFIVENETYSVYQNMDFHTLIVGSSYIIFNTTGFYISSVNDIKITLVYLSDNIFYAGDKDKVLGFYADTTSGTVTFSLSGFPAGNKYLVKKDGSTIGTFTADSSGYITFYNSIWSKHLFEIFQEGEGIINNPPVVSNIPSQTIKVGESFNKINLDNYVYDKEDPDEDIDWSYKGNKELIVSIVNRVVTISVPNSDWYGSETITFTAKDTGGLTDSDAATFTVVYNPPEPPPPEPPPPQPPPPTPPPEIPPADNEENHPPRAPLKPSGPLFVEIGVEYIYSSSSFDIDGDKIRLRFDWGDGNLSEWSEFVDSDTSVSMSHFWSLISIYQVRVIAQDIHGLNSSWSQALNVTLSQTNFGLPPVVAIGISGNNSVNGTIIFDASNSYDPDGYIVSYDWDFGDGKTSSGINTSHKYEKPGDYVITLLVIDNNGSAYSKSIIIDVISYVKNLESGDERVAPLFNFNLFIFGLVLALFALLSIFFRHKITLFVSNHIFYPFINLKISYRKHKIEKLDTRINELSRGVESIETDKILSKQLLIADIKTHYAEIQDSYIKDDSIIESINEEKQSLDELYKIRTGEKVDKLLRMELDYNILSSETRDSETSINVDRLVDDLFASKIRQKIDTL